MRYKLGKLGKYNFMKKFKEVKPFLPETKLATKSNIKSMLFMYRSVYLKPDKGTGGHGIFKVTVIEKKYVLRNGTRTKQYHSFEDLYVALHKTLVRNKYVVQKSIDMLKHNKRQFDIRVMVQKNRKNELVVTGIIGRLANPRKIVTNYHSGGTPLPIDTLLGSHLKGANKIKYINKISFLGKKSSIVLGKNYRRNRAFGVDIAIDSSMKPWVLEVNTQPDMSIFNTLKNKAMYKKILRFSRY